MNPAELQERTLVFAVHVYEFIKPLFRDLDTRRIAEQILGSSTSMAANYRASCLARSHKERLAKIGVVREEADETIMWLVFIERTGSGRGRQETLRSLLDEARQLVRIFAASYRTGQAGS